MKLIADSGSTKTDWCVMDGAERQFHVTTQGINPFHQSEEHIEKVLRDELVPELLRCGVASFSSIEFYGAGCTKAKIPVLEMVIGRVFADCPSVIVDSDLLGAAKALCNDAPGIACILGTGANSCLYDGSRIVMNTSPMGYILGDEGSGAVIGKRLVNEIYKGGHADFVAVFETETGLTQSDIIQKVYREPMPNRFLASLCKFVGRHIAEEMWLDQLVVDCFRDFFRKNIAHYRSHPLFAQCGGSAVDGVTCAKVNFVGSIAFYFEKQLRKAASLEGYEVGRVMKAPLS